MIIIMALKKIFIVILPLLFVTTFQARQNSADCRKRMDFLNDEVDLHAFSFTGRVKEIKILEKSPQSETPQEITTTIKFDEKGRIAETFLSSAKIKMYGRTVYSYDAQHRIVDGNAPDGPTRIKERTITYLDAK